VELICGITRTTDEARQREKGLRSFASTHLMREGTRVWVPKKTANQRKIMNTVEIKTALKMGRTVNWKCNSYYCTWRVLTDEIFIVCRLNNHMIGYTKWHQASDFYIGGAK
jgi:hypothetical protein